MTIWATGPGLLRPEENQNALAGRHALTQCYASTTICALARALMSLHTGHTRIRGNAAVPLGTNRATVAGVLKRRLPDRLHR